MTSKQQLAAILLAFTTLARVEREDARLTAELHAKQAQIDNTRRRRDALNAEYNVLIDQYQREREQLERQFATNQRDLASANLAMNAAVEHLAENGNEEKAA